MTGQRKKNIEVARRAAAYAGLAFAGQPDARAFFDTGRDVDRERALTRDAAGAAAARARILDHLAAALTDRAGSLQREEATLGVADAAVAVAVLTDLPLGAGLGARAPAGLPPHRPPQAGPRLLSREFVL